MPTVQFTKPALVGFNGSAVSDHGRAPLEITVNRIGTTTRMANGTMRQYFVADKREFSMSWETLPGPAAYTVDGYWGADNIENFYNNHSGPFLLTLKNDTGEEKTYNVLFTSFSKSLKFRGIYTAYDVQVSLEEV